MSKYQLLHEMVLSFYNNKIISVDEEERGELLSCAKLALDNELEKVFANTVLDKADALLGSAQSSLDLYKIALIVKNSQLIAANRPTKECAFEYFYDYFIHGCCKYGTVEEMELLLCERYGSLESIAGLFSAYDFSQIIKYRQHGIIKLWFEYELSPRDIKVVAQELLAAGRLAKDSELLQQIKSWPGDAFFLSLCRDGHLNSILILKAKFPDNFIAMAVNGMLEALLHEKIQLFNAFRQMGFKFNSSDAYLQYVVMRLIKAHKIAAIRFLIQLNYISADNALLPKEWQGLWGSDFSRFLWDIFSYAETFNILREERAFRHLAPDDAHLLLEYEKTVLFLKLLVQTEGIILDRSVEETAVILLYKLRNLADIVMYLEGSSDCSVAINSKVDEFAQGEAVNPDDLFVTYLRQHAYMDIVAAFNGSMDNDEVNYVNDRRVLAGFAVFREICNKALANSRTALALLYVPELYALLDDSRIEAVGNRLQRDFSVCLSSTFCISYDEAAIALINDSVFSSGGNSYSPLPISFFANIAVASERSTIANRLYENSVLWSQITDKAKYRIALKHADMFLSMLKNKDIAFSNYEFVNILVAHLQRQSAARDQIVLTVMADNGLLAKLNYAAKLILFNATIGLPQVEIPISINIEYFAWRESQSDLNYSDYELEALRYLACSAYEAMYYEIGEYNLSLESMNLGDISCCVKTRFQVIYNYAKQYPSAALALLYDEHLPTLLDNERMFEYGFSRKQLGMLHEAVALQFINDVTLCSGEKVNQKITVTDLCEMALQEHHTSQVALAIYHHNEIFVQLTLKQKMALAMHSDDLCADIVAAALFIKLAQDISWLITINSPSGFLKRSVTKALHNNPVQNALNALNQAKESLSNESDQKRFYGLKSAISYQISSLKDSKSPKLAELNLADTLTAILDKVEDIAAEALPDQFSSPKRLEVAFCS